MAQMNPQKISNSYLISLTQTWVPIFPLRPAYIAILQKKRSGACPFSLQASIVYSCYIQYKSPALVRLGCNKNVIFSSGVVGL